jgi:hypothetical protein
MRLPEMARMALMVALVACDKETGSAGPPEAAATAPTSTVAAAPEPPRPPDIVVDASNVSVGTDRVATGELGLADKLAVFLTGRSMIEGATVSFVAMRSAKPSHVGAVVAALRRAKATGAVVKSDARDGSTQSVPLSFKTTLADCTTVAWIAKDGAIDVWPAGGGTARRVIKGLAGPDMTLGTEAMRKQWSSCTASEIVVGADDVLTWGLVFDLARSAMDAAGTHVSVAVLDNAAVIGRKVILP